jgi:hypothetical protein
MSKHARISNQFLIVVFYSSLINTYFLLFLPHIFAHKLIITFIVYFVNPLCPLFLNASMAHHSILQTLRMLIQIQCLYNYQKPLPNTFQLTLPIFSFHVVEQIQVYHVSKEIGHQ